MLSGVRASRVDVLVSKIVEFTKGCVSTEVRGQQSCGFRVRTRKTNKGGAIFAEQRCKLRVKVVEGGDCGRLD
jgi:ribosomal protein L34